MAKLKGGTRIYGDITVDNTIVGSAATFTGIVTANSFRGDGSQLTGLVPNTVSTSSVTTPQYIGFLTTNSGVTTSIQASSTLTYIPSSGNLGIGTTNPTSLLQVQGNSIFTGIITASQLDLTTNATANDSILQLSGAPSGTASSNGLLGIGTLNFSDTDIVANFTHNVNSYAQIVLQNKNSGSTASADFIVNNDRAGGTAYYGDFGINATTYSGSSPFNDPDGTYLYAAGGTLAVGTLDAKDFRVATGSAAATPVTRMTITGVGGSVGIATTTPTQSLQVQGNARITGAIYDSTNSPGTSGQVLQSTATGTQWTSSATSVTTNSGGKFDLSIDNTIFAQPTGTLDIVGVGTTTTQITTLPSSPADFVIHSMHVTNISNGDAEITAGFIMNARSVGSTISVSAGSSGGPGIHTFSVGSASSITVGMAVTGTGNIGETTGIGSTAGFQYNTYVTSVDGTNITIDKPMSGRATGILRFSPVSLVASRLPVPVGSAVELLKQPMTLNALDSIVLQSTGAGSGIGSTSTFAVSQTANSNFLTVTAGAAITNFVASGMLILPTGNNTGIQTNTFVGVGYTPGSLTIPMTRPATTSLASTSYSFTEVVTPQDGALQVTIVYQSSSDTSYLNGTGNIVGIVTTGFVAGVTSSVPGVYYGTGNTYPSTIQSIRVSNISDRTIYPGGDYPVWVGIGNSDTVFSWLAYNMIIPKNSSIELCEAPKRLGIGQSIFAYTNTPNVLEIQVSGRQKTV